MKKTSTIILLVLLLAANSCQVNHLTNIKVSDAYNPDAEFTTVQFFAYHISDSTTRIYYRINTGDLLYERELNAPQFQADIKVRLELYNSQDPKTLSDSLSLRVIDTSGYQKKIWLMDSVDLRVPAPGKYYLQLRLTDLNKKASNTSGLYLYKNGSSSRQNYMCRDARNLPLFSESWEENGNFRIFTRNNLVPRLFVRYYDNEFPIALPPFVESKSKGISIKPDSVFFIEMDNGTSSPLSFKKKGIYHIQTDTSNLEGFTLFRFYQGYPEINTADQMRLCLRYISTKSEFNDMMMMKNAKDAVDNFWLDKTDNPDRAKELIRKYYNRVIEANKYFTSYHEGWKTDRGLIYIIFGPPTLVYRNPGNETWIYGEDRNLLSITFVFEKIDNPFSDNDYELNRSQEYKDVWYSALEGWRN